MTFEPLMADADRAKRDRWDRYFLGVAQLTAQMSKDPSTKVGAVLVSPDRAIIATGFNGLPRGIDDTHERLHTREVKIELVVHAEINAILNAARIGIAVGGASLYLIATDEERHVAWGGPPCLRCSVEVVQAGISEIVSLPQRAAPSRWHESLVKAHAVLAEAGIRYRETWA